MSSDTSSPRATADQLRRYLARIACPDVTTDAPPTAALLARLHEAHLRAIPFENLEIHLGRPMRIEPDELFADLVDRRRGGYCFQMNELFALALTAFGYRVERFAARVWFGNPLPLPPCSHQCLRVTAGDGSRWFCDVGFGGASPLRPVPFGFDRPAAQGLADYVLAPSPRHGVLVRTRLPGGEWQDMISFAEHEQHPIDFRYANFAISTMPGSRFVQQRIASFVRGDARLNLQDRTLRRITPAGVTVETLTAAAEERLLRDDLGLDLPTPLPWA